MGNNRVQIYFYKAPMNFRQFCWFGMYINCFNFIILNVLPVRSDGIKPTNSHPKSAAEKMQCQIELNHN